MIRKPGLVGASLLAVAALAVMGSSGPLIVTTSHAAERATAAFQTISSAQLATMLEHKDFAFINVHVPYEGEIASTDAFIAFDHVADNLDLLPADQSAPIVLYCRSGRMSEIAANELVKLGYTNVSHLDGGMNAWVAAGGVLSHN